MRLTKLSTHLASNPDKFTTDGTATTTATLNTLPYIIDVCLRQIENRFFRENIDSCLWSSQLAWCQSLIPPSWSLAAAAK